MTPSPPRLLFISTAMLFLSQCASKTPAIVQSGTSEPLTVLQAANQPDESNLVIRLADIDSVDVGTPGGQPLAAKITIRGLLHDGATQIHKIDQQKFADGLSLTVTTARPKNSVARVALIPFERSVSVDLSGLPKGECFITVNNYRALTRIP